MIRAAVLAVLPPWHPLRSPFQSAAHWFTQVWPLTLLLGHDCPTSPQRPSITTAVRVSTKAYGSRTSSKTRVLPSAMRCVDQQHAHTSWSQPPFFAQAEPRLSLHRGTSHLSEREYSAQARARGLCKSSATWCGRTVPGLATAKRRSEASPRSFALTPAQVREAKKSSIEA